MRTFFISLLLAVASVAILANSSQAWIGGGPGSRFLFTPPNPADAAFAELVVVGRGKAIVGWKLQATGEWLGDKKAWDYRMVEIDVLEVLKGPKELKKLTVGIIDFNGRELPKQIADGQTALFFIEKNDREKCYLAPQHYHVVTTNRPNYETFVAETREEIARWGDQKMKIMKDPQAGLRAMSFDERMFAATVLITRYRTPVGKPPYETEPIDAEESRSILRTLAEANWQFEKGYPNFSSKKDNEVFRNRYLLDILDLPGLTSQQVPHLRLYFPSSKTQGGPRQVWDYLPPYHHLSGMSAGARQAGQQTSYLSPYSPIPVGGLMGNSDSYRIRRYVQPADKTSGKKD